jgi:peptidoglycan/xylan/chitin deacetylase (PgdA/CDA1 family)
MIWRLDDVLQSTLYSQNQRDAFKEKGPFEWFKEAVELLKGQEVKLAIVAEGIDHYPEWVEYIKAHPEWEIACHGLEHRIYKWLPPQVTVGSLIVAKWKLEETFKREVTELHLPKLLWHENLVGLAKLAGFKLMDERINIDNWVENPRGNEVYFHFWNKRQINVLKKCLLTNEKQ